MGRHDISGGERRGWRRLWSHRAGNIALITALLMIPLMFAVGMAFDYTMAQSRKDKLDGIADAAVLGAVTPAEMALPFGQAQQQAKALFDGQAATVSGVISADGQPGGAGDQTSGNSVTRQVSISYTAQSQNVFAALLGMPTMTITGSSSAQSATAPNIDFYLMLDTSPSMEIAATSLGIAALQNNTATTDVGDRTCAFGCHQSDPSTLTPDDPTNCTHVDPATGRSTTQCQFLTSSYQKIPCTANGAYADGTTFTTSSTFPETGRDYYDLSRCLNVTLRIDLLNTATQNLMSSAASMSADYKTKYQMALYLTDTNQANTANDLSLYTLQRLTPNLNLAKSQAATIGSMEMYQNNHLVAGDSNDDMDTYLDADLDYMNTNVLPTPGNGTNNRGDTPQEVLFIVTDALNDVGPSRNYPPMDWNGQLCAKIKARGIRIAVLYTQYIPFSGFFETAVAPTLPKGLPQQLPASTPVGSDPMALAAQQCASTGLYAEVTTDGDISQAMQTLFEKVVTTARLTH